MTIPTEKVQKILNTKTATRNSRMTTTGRGVERKRSVGNEVRVWCRYALSRAIGMTALEKTIKLLAADGDDRGLRVERTTIGTTAATAIAEGAIVVTRGTEATAATVGDNERQTTGLRKGRQPLRSPCHRPLEHPALILINTL